MMRCFGCFGANDDCHASSLTRGEERRAISSRLLRCSQVADVSHLLGPAEEDRKQNTQVKRFMTLVQTPWTGEHAYELLGDVGSAQNSADVKLMRHKRSKELVTIKYVKHGADILLDKNIEREILNHRRLSHPNILGFREVFTTDTHLGIVVEHASTGSLANRCEGRCMAEAQARRLFAQLLDGLAYCHAQGVFHRDLRIEHVLLSGSVYEPVVKIGSFGFSKSAMMDSMAKTAVGVRGYMAPEVLMSSGQYDAAKTDVWACGVILYQMLTGRLPFCHDSNASGVLDRAMMQRIMRGQYYLPDNLELSMEAQDVVCRVFQPDPQKRISLAALRRHPWLTGSAPQLQPGPSLPGSGLPQQSEDDISMVIRRARQRRLQHKSAAAASGPELGRPSSCAAAAKHHRKDKPETLRGTYEE
ncbi:hypothetical protein CVIRNUC_004058 [Coccomyxa viridis]|uniref:Protein kinase domain-containing protein n=1 Tax=Coccomyxa viridis TaxID=1274662 RepID=A0AAV1I4U5_9CHLO|nr:hypothetical protein CVIRNUC_004058 [Coccomyxa viridis]